MTMMSPVLTLHNGNGMVKHKTVSPITTEAACLHCHAAIVQGLAVTGYCAYCGHKVCFVGGCIEVHDRICKGYHWSREMPKKEGK